MFMLVFTGYSQQSNQSKILIVVRSDVLDDTTAVYITGSDVKLGNWDPSKIKMQNSGNHTWTISMFFDKSTDLEYKFTLGSWQKECLDTNGSVFPNNTLTVRSDTVINFIINKWGTNIKKFSGQITGKVKYYKNISGKNINPRDIIIWLPPDYNYNTLKRYPVLYMHDGQNIIDPATSFNGVDWQIDETADSLIKCNKMKEIIIVGIYNTKNRTAEYSYSDSGYAYINFIINELKPFIDKTYRTIPNCENTITMGSSMGGLISFMLAWEHPEVFSGAICFSPALKVAEFDYLPFIEKYNGPEKNIKFYFYNGGVGLEKEIQPGLDEAIKLLIRNGYKDGKDFEYYIDSTGGHNETSWAKNSPSALLFFFRK